MRVIEELKDKIFNRRKYVFAVPLMFFFILYLFYLSSHIALTRTFFAIFDHWPRYSFLVPDSCWATIRNSNTIYAYKFISANFTEDIIKNDKDETCFLRQIDSCFWAFDITRYIQYIYIPSYVYNLIQCIPWYILRPQPNTVHTMIHHTTTT